MGIWNDEVNLVLERARSISLDKQGLKNILFGVWSLMRGADGKIRDLYRSFSEQEILDGSASYDVNHCIAEIKLPGGTMAEKRLVFLELAMRLRALETVVLSYFDGGLERNSASYEVEFDGRRGYFLHHAPRNRTPKDKGTFVKRGLARSRMLPRFLTPEVEVRIHPFSDPRGALRSENGSELKFGAGIFEGLEFSFGSEKDGFVVTSAACPDQISVISKQILDASNDACCGVVYPELTIDESVVRQISSEMENGNLETELSLIVAGSRHARGVDGLVRNTATVLDGYGEIKVEQSKFYRYSNGSKPSEAIEPGTELAVIVLEDAVLVCAICLDFCHRTEATPYHELDVDYILVPSCGEGVTMESHLDKAKSLYRTYSIKTLVVQQFHDEDREPVDTDPLGYRLESASLKLADASTLATDNPWLIVAL